MYTRINQSIKVDWLRYKTRSFALLYIMTKHPKGVLLRAFKIFSKCRVDQYPSPSPSIVSYISPISLCPEFPFLQPVKTSFAKATLTSCNPVDLSLLFAFSSSSFWLPLQDVIHCHFISSPSYIYSACLKFAFYFLLFFKGKVII